MNWVDIVIIIFLAVLAILGLKRGLMKSLFPLVGIILGIFLAGTFQGALAEKLSFIESESVARIAAFAIIVVVVFVAAIIASSVLSRIFSMILLGWVDRLGGALFGLAIAWFISSAVVVLLARYAALPVELPESAISSVGESVVSSLNLEGIRQSIYTAIKESTLVTWQIHSFPVILNLLPGEFDAVKDFFGG